ncbi:MAG: MAPEG family protein [Wenzhouxiangella sp.]
MNTAYIALAGFTGWTLLLVLALLVYRVSVILKGRSAANAWPRGTHNPADPPLIHRLQDAHQNCLESLPVFAVIVLIGMGMDELASIAVPCLLVLFLRLGQSISHLAGTSHNLVFVRGSLFGGQLLLFVYMLIGLLT